MLTVELVAGGGKGGFVTSQRAGRSGEKGENTTFGALFANAGTGGIPVLRNHDRPSGGKGGAATGEGFAGEDGTDGQGRNTAAPGGKSGSRNVTGLAGYGDGSAGAYGTARRTTSTGIVRTATGSGGGGGGGAYRRAQIAVTAGDNIAYHVGAGGDRTELPTSEVVNTQDARDGAIRITYEAGPAAPNFSDDTGDDLAWRQGDKITPVVVPEASGNPAPAYSVVGALPDGIAFDAATRTLSGTPTKVGSGTITIRATNSQGTDDWTVDYKVTPPPPPGVLDAVIGDGASGSRFSANLTPGLLIPPGLVAGGGTAYLRVVSGNSIGDMRLATDTDADRSTAFSGLSGPELTDAWETYAEAITFSAGGLSVIVPGPNFPSFSRRDPTESYSWTLNGTYLDDWKAFLTAYLALAADVRATTRIQLRDKPLPVAPKFADDTGDPITGMVSVRIDAVTVPEASGMPDPVYAVVGALPGGLAFDPATRRLTGAPTEAGDGTITIRATNAGGTADWSVAYDFAPLPLELELSEKLTLSDDATLLAGKTVDEKLTIKDSLTLEPTKVLSERLTLRDSISIGYEHGIELEDSMTLGDEVGFGLERGQDGDERLTIRDSITMKLELGISGEERLSLDDSLALELDKQVTENLTLRDDVAFGLTKQFEETLYIHDEVTLDIIDPKDRDLAGVPARNEDAVWVGIYIRMHFVSGIVRIWSGRGVQIIDGERWIGAGDLLGIVMADETADLTANGCQVTLSAIPVSILARFSPAEMQSREASIHFACVHPGTVPRELMLLFKGTMESAHPRVKGEACTLAFKFESPLRKLNRAWPLYYSSASQRARYPGDSGFDWVAGLPEAWPGLKWGAGNSS